ncbi:LysR family transcriptional regulator [Burkholderia sp. AU19243]|uniref:LysR family transcriptional regulator n=1 Tax=Burkholderia latens TaxID=488446 RepID=A0AAP1GBX6_9BURK|nr:MULTISPECIES: LysR family transcriptional regulator [Burkholderia]AIO42346.1 bacterial regulatory helix-turn-helix, lysR family protein [Burkholderia cenocepacia]MBR7961384.1 LysR family transcriptional regulator [Burkholderia vietnamiensis]AOK04464.1 LysR family transcriptional regulator [Burkholderia latens]KVA11743.1 LysR family transcriptional regulator [Burkholderia latens]MBR8142917.1 LysR family transcriptional regulator [Burkholderia vietnamiensis]
MDRIDAMKVFVATLDEGSLAGASRRLGRSPAAVSRAIAFLEEHTGTALLYRTTRTIRLSEAGERYAAACRRILADLEEADMLIADARSAPRGLLTVTAPVAAGEDVLRALIDEFIDRHPAVSVRLQLLDRPVSLIDEGIDVALRIAHLTDSTLVAIPVGSVRRVVVASPRYLAAHPPIAAPADLARHRIISMTHFGLDSWSFPPSGHSALPQVVQFVPRFIVNTIRGALASALDGHGVTRLFSYHVAEQIRDGSLQIVLRDSEHAPLPIHLVTPYGRLSVPKVRTFVDFAAPRLREHFARLAAITDGD